VVSVLTGKVNPAVVELGEPCHAAVVAGVDMVAVEPGKSSRGTVGDAVKLCAVGNEDVLALSVKGIVS
jgi:hypothetical protein